MGSAAMNLLRTILLLTLCLALSVSKAQQSTTKNAAQGSDFLIDPSKPYVYLELDHVGPRKPLRASEPNTGLWLHLENNCKLPIVVMALGAPPSVGTEVQSVVDEVVPNLQASGAVGDGVGGGVLIPHGLEEMTDIFRTPNMTEAEIRSAEDVQKRVGKDFHSKSVPERPQGYNSGYEPVASTLTIVPPGGQLLFSVPVNHVSEFWHFEIPFRLALPNKGRIRSPYSYVAFYQEDLRDSHGNAAPPTPTTH